MNEELFSVEQAAEVLGLHPKTVRNYIREGRLKAKKIGKQWRITAADLQKLTGGASAIGGQEQPVETSRPAGSRREKVQVSAVVDVYVENGEEAYRLSSTIIAAMNSKDRSYGQTRCDYFYDEEGRNARFILWGRPRFIATMMTLLSGITE